MKTKTSYLGIFLLFIIAAIPFNIEKQVMGVWVTTTDILVLAALAAWLIKFVRNRDHLSSLSKPLLIPVAGLLSIFVITSVTAISPMAAIKETCKYFLIFALFYLFVNELDDGKLLKKVPAIIFISSFIISVWFLADFFVHKLPFYYIKDWDRHPFSHMHFNLLGSYLVLALPMGLAAMQENIGWKCKLCLSVMLLTQMTALLFTYSRINWISAVLIILFFMVYRFKMKGIVYFFVLIGAATMVIPHVRADLKIKERIESLLNKHDGSYVERLELSNAAMQLIKRKPFTGIGVNNFNIASKKYLNLELNNMVHNIYLQFWTEAGIFALLFILLLLMQYYYDVIRLSRTIEGTSTMSMLLVYGTVAFSALVLSNQFGDPFVRILKEYFALLLALPYAIRGAAQKESVV